MFFLNEFGIIALHAMILLILLSWRFSSIKTDEDVTQEAFSVEVTGSLPTQSKPWTRTYKFFSPPFFKCLSPDLKHFDFKPSHFYFLLYIKWKGFQNGVILAVLCAAHLRQHGFCRLDLVCAAVNWSLKLNFELLMKVYSLHLIITEWGRQRSLPLHYSVHVLPVCHPPVCPPPRPAVRLTDPDSVLRQPLAPWRLTLASQLAQPL